MALVACAETTDAGKLILPTSPPSRVILAGICPNIVQNIWRTPSAALSPSLILLRVLAAAIPKRWLQCWPPVASWVWVLPPSLTSLILIAFTWQERSQRLGT